MADAALQSQVVQAKDKTLSDLDKGWNRWQSKHPFKFKPVFLTLHEESDGFEEEEQEPMRQRSEPIPSITSRLHANRGRLPAGRSWTELAAPSSRADTELAKAELLESEEVATRLTHNFLAEETPEALEIEVSKATEAVAASLAKNSGPGLYEDCAGGLATPPIAPAEWAGTMTIMMRNLPNKYTQRMLLVEINHHGFLGTFDFLYVPIDPETSANRGYAFLNFIDPGFAWMFKMTYECKKMNKFNSNKVVTVAPAALQGFESNYAHYASSRVNRGDPAARPLFFREPHSNLALSVSGRCQERTAPSCGSG